MLKAYVSWMSLPWAATRCRLRPPVKMIRWWGASGSRKMIGHVTLSSFVTINYRQPFDYASRGGRTRSWPRPTSC